MRPRLRYRTPLLIVLAVLLVFSILSLSLRQSPALTRVSGLVITVTSPGLQALEYLVRTGKRLWLGYFDLVPRGTHVVRFELDQYRKSLVGGDLEREIGFRKCEDGRKIEFFEALVHSVAGLFRKGHGLQRELSQVRF